MINFLKDLLPPPPEPEPVTSEAGWRREMLVDLFAACDDDGSGALSLNEFHKCIREAELGLTRKEINRLMQEVDADQDGIVTYEEFVPLCFDMLVELLKDELLKVPPVDLPLTYH